VSGPALHPDQDQAVAKTWQVPSKSPGVALDRIISAVSRADARKAGTTERFQVRNPPTGPIWRLRGCDDAS
jgi:hypothetical protein